VGYLSDSVDYSSSSWVEWFTDVGVLPCFSSADGEAFGFTRGCGCDMPSLRKDGQS
jgi:hypothetical protein